MGTQEASMFRPFLTLFVLLTLATTALTPAPASACGGFFCSGTNLTPVDQNAERVLFEVNDDGTVTAVVEISFTGSPTDFSWVVPVPDTPVLDIVPPSTLQLLDAATSPLIRPPFIQYPDWGDDDDDSFGDDDDDDNSSDDDDATGGEVDVTDLPQVGPFDPQVISSTDPGALVDWLNDNGYLITPEMEPTIATYVMGGMKFLGMKMAPEAGVADIAPIKMTYPATEPMLPIILTSVAAEPEMSVVVFVAGNTDYESLNYVTLEIDRSAVQADPRTGANNYFSLLSWRADQLGGRAFFSEFSGSGNTVGNKLGGVFLGTSDELEARQELLELLNRSERVTRLYTRISPDEMSVDPVFSAIQTDNIDNVVDLRQRPEVWWDQTDLPTPPCGDTYCGEGSCAVAENGAEGCVCDSGYAARRIESPPIANLNGFQDRARVTCQDRRFDMMESMDVSGNSCSWTCGGAGLCERIGGMPTCVCDEGYVAVPLGGFLTPEPLTCRRVETVYTNNQLLWPNWPFGPSEETVDAEAAQSGVPAPPACLASVSATPSTPLALLLGFVALALRRIRRASEAS
jgi:hypothetical protein